MKRGRFLWYIPAIILGPAGFVLGAVGVGMIILMDMCIDKARRGGEK